jgi:tetratricopeptide (TPR) repeat protein
MPEPVTIAAVAIGGLSWLCQSTVGSAAISGAIGNAADRVMLGTLRDMKNRIAGLRGLPQNHDVARAVRTAQVHALEKLIRDYRDIGRPEWQTDEHTRPDIFFDRGLSFCTETIGRYRLGSNVKPALEITAALEKAIDGILDEPEGDRPAARRAAEIARLAEDAVLDELREQLAGVVFPDGFEAHFRGGNAGCTRFLDLFGHFIREQIKQDDRFRAILTTGQLSRIEGMVYDTATVLTEGFAQVRNTLADMEAASERRYRDLREELARDKGVDPKHLVPLFEYFGQAGLTLDEIRSRAPELIEETLARARQPVERSNDGADIETTIAAARQKLGNFDMAGARSVVAEKIAEEETARLQRLIPLLEEQAAIERLSYDHASAQATLRKLLALDPDRVWDWIGLGDSFVVTGSLPDAVKAYSEAADAARRTGDERDRMVTEIKIADVRVRQGDRPAALAAYKLVLNLRAYPSRNVCSGPPPIWDGEKDFMEAPEAVCSG